MYGMLQKIVLALFGFMVLLPANSNASFYKNDPKDFSECKVHYSRQERNYKVFYNFESMKHKPLNDSLALDFHFYVLAASDAHILLAPSSTLSSLEPVYEIVIGAGGNTFSDIRRMQKQQVRASIRLTGALSAIDIKSFWIHISKDGNIDVGKGGETEPFLHWKDTDLLPLKVFSFSTWGDVEAKWFYDCPIETNKTNQDKEPVLTDLERLRRDILTHYNPYVTPVYNIIQFNMISHYISLDEEKSILHIQGTAELNWNDEKLVWNSSEYGGIKELHAFHGEVWKPQLRITQCALVDNMDTFESSMVIVRSDGAVFWKPAVNSFSWCDASKLGHWPRDKHTCDLEIKMINAGPTLHPIYDISNEFLSYREQLNTGWDVLRVSFDADDGAALKLSVSFMRVSGVYGTALFSPFILIATCMLLTFWQSPLGHSRLSLACVPLLLSSLLLIALALIIPGHPSNVPFLVFLYSACILGNVGCVLITIIVINLCRNDQSTEMPHTLCKILYLNCVETMLILPQKKVESGFGDMTYLRPSIHDTWVRCASAIDRISFIIYLLLVLSACFTQY